MIDALSSRFSICLLIAFGLHAGVLFGITAPYSDAPKNRPLQVTLATLPTAQVQPTDTLATINQRGKNHSSQVASSNQSIDTADFKTTSRQPAQLGEMNAVSAPVLARDAGTKQIKDGQTKIAFRSSNTATLSSEAAKTRTAKSDLRAAYLESWRKIVEQAGNRSLPDDLLQQAAGKRLTLEVTLDADGYLLATRVRHSSGSTSLDTAAQNILRNASPFSSFPPALRARHTQLSFAYDWRFTNEIASNTESAQSERQPE